MKSPECRSSGLFGALLVQTTSGGCPVVVPAAGARLREADLETISFMDYRGKSCEHTHPVLCRASESQHARKRFAALRWWKAPLKKLGLLATVGR